MSGKIGVSTNRIDGRLKVTGAARYPNEIPVANLAHAVAVGSAIARGSVRRIDSREALGVPGVLAVITHDNSVRLQPPPAPNAGGQSGQSGQGNQNQQQPFNQQGGQQQPNQQNAGGQQSGGSPSSESRPSSGGGQQQPRPSEGKGLLQDNIIHYAGQHIAVVVAETLEVAEHAAGLLKVVYQETVQTTVFTGDERDAEVPTTGLRRLPPRGDADSAFNTAEIKVDERYSTPYEHHNPMGLYGSIAVWDGDRLTVHDANQGVRTARGALAYNFRLPPENVRVVSSFVGGGFGSGLRAWAHPTLAAMAARVVRRPVKLVLSRRQMFTSNGYRNPTEQRVALGANRDGKLTAIIHEGTTPSCRFTTAINGQAGFVEKSTMLYACPNVRTDVKVVRLDIPQGTPMRAPGSAEGVFALESALDELAYKLKLDPIELRRRNYADRDPESGKPWSSNSLRECYQKGAEVFGWARRNPEPGSMRDGRYLVGMGMATATYPARTQPCSARVRLNLDGDNIGATVETSATDVGPGTYTALAQIAAETLGLTVRQVQVKLADTDLPNAPQQGGSFLLASTGSAVHNAALNLITKILQAAQTNERSQLRGASPADIEASNAQIRGKGTPAANGESYVSILRRANLRTVEADGDSVPPSSGETTGGSSSQPSPYSSHSFGAQFCEVRVDPDTGEARVTRFAGVYAAGKIINPKTAGSQIIGGIVGGIGMALTEETAMDGRTGRFVNRTLADYHVPTNADSPRMEIIFLDEQDSQVNALGIKGVGELCIVGVAPAIANAVFHATGKRIRELPITPDKLL